MHTLDNGICVTCQPAHVLEDGRCSCSRSLDPHHDGQFADITDQPADDEEGDAVIEQSADS